MKQVLSMVAVSVIMVGLTACSGNNSALNKPPGDYSSTTSYDNADGTSVSKKKTESVGYDANGNKTATVKTQTTVDPPGLFNKSTTTTTDVEQ